MNARLAAWWLGLAIACVACGAGDPAGAGKAPPRAGSSERGGALAEKQVSGVSGSAGGNDAVGGSDSASGNEAVGGSDAASGNDDAGGSNDAGGIDCDPRKITCKRTAPTCGQFEVPSVEGACYGPCVGIESCACTGPEQCPDANQFTCHMSAKHCTPYLH